MMNQELRSKIICHFEFYVNLKHVMINSSFILNSSYFK